MSQDRIYLDIPFHDNQKAREMGALWDRQARSWYDPSADGKLSSIWGPRARGTDSAANSPGPEPKKEAKEPTRVYLKVPYGQKEQAKALGARWDPGRRLWYIPGRVRHPQREELLGG